MLEAVAGEPLELAVVEVLVLDGALDYGETHCGALTWLRIPHGQERPMATREGCRLWVKRGHLRD